MQPTPSPTPPSTPPPAPQPPLPGPEVPGEPTPPKKSYKGLIIGLVVGGILLLVLLGVGAAVAFTALSSLQKRVTVPGQDHMGSKMMTDTKKSSSTCLAVSDYEKTYPIFAKNTTELWQDNEVDTVFFIADSTDYQYPEITDEKLATAADFIQQNASKKFTVHIKGSVNGDNGQAGGGVLSTQRAEKVRDGLVAKGADASKLVVDPPAVYDQGANPSEFYQSVFRNVGIIVHDDCLSDK